ncbi:MAG: C40 family peptidase [Muribaculaceae bacterium]|nr:C40 family peptidase [Muribaculaceae bacterium]
MLKHYGKTILILAAAILMSLPVVSCRSTSSNTHSYRPYHERRNRSNDHNDGSERESSCETDKKKPKPQGNGLVSEEWANLDIKLGRHDNKELYKELKRWLGTPYSYAAHTCGEGTDCSGLVMEVYLKVYGIKVHRNSAKMLEQNCRVIDLDDLREGDLVFFITSSDGHVSHVGIYLKDNKFVHASSSRGVVVDDLRQNYFATHFHAAARVVTE